MLEWLIDSLVLSLFMGSIYVLASIGLTLTLSVVKLPNFAHAEFLTIGGYMGVIVTSYFPDNLFGACLSAFAVCGLTALFFHYVIFRPLLRRSVSTYAMILASFALATMVRYLIFILATLGNVLQAHPSIRITVLGQIFSTTFSNIEAIAIALAVILSSLLGLFLGYTSLGREMRAIASNMDLARVSGVRVSLIIPLMWVIAGGLAGIGGVFLGVYTSVTPVLGFNVLLQIFAVVIIAGLTSFSGTVVGGYFVGLAENTTIAFLANYFSVPFTYKPMLPFALILIVLLFKPTGITPNIFGSFMSLIKGRKRENGI
jgi:branched-chain amino acid transport system permease protein